MKRSILFIALFLITINVLAQDLYSLGATAFDRENANIIGGSVDDMTPLPTNANFEGGVSVNGSDFISAGMSINNGPAATIAYSITSSDTVEILFRIIADPAHVGQPADILVTVGYIDFQAMLDNALSGMEPTSPWGGPDPIFFMLDQQSNVFGLPKHWGGDDIIPFRTLILQSVQDIPLYRGSLASGALFINCYYRLQDGTLVFNRDLISTIIFPDFLSIF